MNYTTKKGTTLTVEDNRLTVTVNGIKLQSAEHTVATVADWAKFGRITLRNGGAKAAVLYDDDFRAWERDNWPLVKSAAELWTNIAPADAKAYMVWHEAFLEERAARARGNWTVNAGAEPAVGDDAAAYLYIDGLMDAANVDHNLIGRKYRDAVIGGMDLVSAAVAAKAEMSSAAKHNMWD